MDEADVFGEEFVIGFQDDHVGEQGSPFLQPKDGCFFLFCGCVRLNYYARDPCGVSRFVFFSPPYSRFIYPCLIPPLDIFLA